MWNIRYPQKLVAKIKVYFFLPVFDCLETSYFRTSWRVMQHKTWLKILWKVPYFSSWMQNTEQTAIKYSMLIVQKLSWIDEIIVMTYPKTKGLWTSVFSSYVLSHTRRILTRRYEKEKARTSFLVCQKQKKHHLYTYLNTFIVYKIAFTSRKFIQNFIFVIY